MGRQRQRMRQVTDLLSLMGSMSYSNDELQEILWRSRGQCHICRGAPGFPCSDEPAPTLANYGRVWHVDHKRARSKGGSNHPSNLWVAHANANRAKRDRDMSDVLQGYGRCGKWDSHAGEECRRRVRLRYGNVCRFHSRAVR
jgi:hypothetical protein